MKSLISLRAMIASALCLTLAMPVPAQLPPSSPTGSPSAAAPSTTKSFSQEELDQLLAPIALYPDALLAQVLMASTYPLEIVSAERWVKANPSLKGKPLEDALQSQPWDPAVKSLAVFPQVLAMMSEKLDWTQKLGDAFLAQQQEVMATAQTLRAKAVAQGTLKDTKEQKITTEAQNNTTIIKIEPVNPEVVYVPTYNPTVVYGAWPYPAYPPYYWYPPGYAYPYGGALLGFTAGAIIGVRGIRRLPTARRHRVAMSRGAKPFRVVSPDQFRAAQPDCRWFPRASTRARPRTRSTGRDAETLR